LRVEIRGNGYAGPAKSTRTKGVKVTDSGWALPVLDLSASSSGGFIRLPTGSAVRFGTPFLLAALRLELPDSPGSFERTPSKTQNNLYNIDLGAQSRSLPKVYPSNPTRTITLRSLVVRKSRWNSTGSTAIGLPTCSALSNSPTGTANLARSAAATSGKPVAGMPVTGQPAHVGQQRRLRNSGDLVAPAERFADLPRRVERDLVTWLDSVRCADVEH